MCGGSPKVVNMEEKIDTKELNVIVSFCAKYLLFVSPDSLTLYSSSSSFIEGWSLGPHHCIPMLYGSQWFPSGQQWHETGGRERGE